MKREYDNIDSFIKDLKDTESLRQTIIDMGYLKEDDFSGSKCSCIFHKGDRTPSLQVTDHFFKCYGCSAKGDLIKWVSMVDNLSFIESIDKLASFFNCDIKKSGKISKNSLLRNKLKNEWETYLEDFKKEVVDNKDLLELAKKYFPFPVGYDKSINYLVLAFTTKSGNIAGFTKRRINENDMPKWRHSNMENSLLSECHNIFNLANACKSIKENNGEVLISEGPGDVVKLIHAGYKNSVAISGTSNFTDKMLDILDPVNSFILVMDGDKAGIKATYNAVLTLSTLRPHAILDSYVVPLPDGSDPGSLSKEELKQCIDNKQKMLDWFIDLKDDELLGFLVKTCKSEILKPQILQKAMVSRHCSFAQINEIIENGYQNYLKNNQVYEKKENRVQSPQDEYKLRLLATIGKIKSPDIEMLDISEDKAKRILKLRYKENH